MTPLHLIYQLAFLRGHLQTRLKNKQAFQQLSVIQKDVITKKITRYDWYLAMNY